MNKVMNIIYFLEDNLFVELPIQCTKEVGTLEYNEATVVKWLNETDVMKQFQFINDKTLALYLYDLDTDISFDTMKDLPREELLKWALYDICLSINE